MSPETRTTSPWTTEPIRITVGHQLMQVREPLSVYRHADQAPWHPLEPVSLARVEHTSPQVKFFKSKPEDGRPSPPTGLRIHEPYEYIDGVGKKAKTIRLRFLAQLTLKRLREADEKLYGRDTLGEYAAWADQTPAGGSIPSESRRPSFAALCMAGKN